GLTLIGPTTRGPILRRSNCCAPTSPRLRTIRDVRSMIPVASRAFHCIPVRSTKQDRVHRVPVGHARVVTAERVRRPRRQQWLHPRPHLIRYPPTIVFDHETHGL